MPSWQQEIMCPSCVKFQMNERSLKYHHPILPPSCNLLLFTSFTCLNHLNYHFRSVSSCFTSIWKAVNLIPLLLMVHEITCISKITPLHNVFFKVWNERCLLLNLTFQPKLQLEFGEIFVYIWHRIELMKVCLSTPPIKSGHRSQIQLLLALPLFIVYVCILENKTGSVQSYMK